jgi:hypothetical protein
MRTRVRVDTVSVAALLISLAGVGVETRVRALHTQPLVITSKAFARHVPPAAHPECPERVLHAIDVLEAHKVSL